jgi:hypothetical protein
MKCKGFGKKRSLLEFKVAYYFGIRLDGPRKTTKNLSQESRYPGRDLNPGPPEYEGVFNHSTTTLMMIMSIW